MITFVRDSELSKNKFRANVCRVLREASSRTSSPEGLVVYDFFLVIQLVYSLHTVLFSLKKVLTRGKIRRKRSSLKLTRKSKTSSFLWQNNFENSLCVCNTNIGH